MITLIIILIIGLNLSFIVNIIQFRNKVSDLKVVREYEEKGRKTYEVSYTAAGMTYLSTFKSNKDITKLGLRYNTKKPLKLETNKEYITNIVILVLLHLPEISGIILYAF